MTKLGVREVCSVITYSAIALIVIGNFFYAFQCIFQTRKYIEKYGFGEGSAIMTRLVGTFAAGFAITLSISLFISIKGSWLLFVYGFLHSGIGAIVCYKTIHSHWGSCDGVRTTAEGYIAPAVIAFLNLVVLCTAWDVLFKI